MDDVCDKKPLTLIVGENGEGKTALFTAIKLAIYGREVEKNILSKIIPWQSREEGKTYRTESSVVFVHKEKKYRVTYAIEYKGKGEPPKDDRNKITFEVLNREHDILTLTEHGPVSVGIPTIEQINKILPSNIKDYFLFDAEKLRESLEDSNELIKKGIERSLNLKAISITITKFLSLSDRYRRDANRTQSGEDEKIIAEGIDELTKKLTELFTEIDTNNNEKDAITKIIKELDSKIEGLGPAKDKAAELKQARKQLKLVGEDISEALKNIANSSYNAFSLALYEERNKLITCLDEQKEKGKIPGLLTQSIQVLEEIKNGENCVCGKPHNQLTKNNINKLINEYSETNIDNSSLLDTLISLKTLQNKQEEYVRDFIKKKLKVDLGFKDQRTLKNKIELIEEEIGEIDDTDIQELNAKRKEKSEEKEKLINKLNKLQIEYDSKEKLKVSEQKKLDSCATQNKKYNENILKTKLTKVSADLLSVKYSEFISLLIKKLNVIITSEWPKYVRSTAGLTATLADDFSLNAYRGTVKVTNELSEGQFQCLMFVFINALLELSHKDPLLVIDMPFGRLSKSPIGVITKVWSKSTNQKILTLTKGQEYNEERKKELGKISNKIIWLEEIDGNGYGSFKYI